MSEIATEFEGMYPLHEELGSGEIEGEGFRILQSMAGSTILIEYPKEEYDNYPKDREAYQVNIREIVKMVHDQRE